MNKRRDNVHRNRDIRLIFVWCAHRFNNYLKKKDEEKGNEQNIQQKQQQKH